MNTHKQIYYTLTRSYAIYGFDFIQNKYKKLGILNKYISKTAYIYKYNIFYKMYSSLCLSWVDRYTKSNLLRNYERFLLNIFS